MIFPFPFFLLLSCDYRFSTIIFITIANSVLSTVMRAVFTARFDLLAKSILIEVRRLIIDSPENKTGETGHEIQIYSTERTNPVLLRKRKKNTLYSAPKDTKRFRPQKPRDNKTMKSRKNGT